MYRYIIRDRLNVQYYNYNLNSENLKMIIGREAGFLLVRINYL